MENTALFLRLSVHISLGLQENVSVLFPKGTVCALFSKVEKLQRKHTEDYGR